MNSNYLDYKKKFDVYGYFVFKDFSIKDFVSKLADNINKAPDIEKYFNHTNNLRIIKKIYDKGKNLELYLKNNLNFVNAYLFFSYIRILNQKK